MPTRIRDGSATDEFGGGPICEMSTLNHGGGFRGERRPRAFMQEDFVGLAREASTRDVHAQSRTRIFWQCLASGGNC